MRFADHYTTGAIKAAEDLDLPLPNIHRGELTEEVGKVMAAPTFSVDGPFALACNQHGFAFGAFRAAAAKGLRFGEDATNLRRAELPRLRAIGTASLDLLYR